MVGIIGYPIDYTLSPAIHNAAFCSLEMNWLYIPMRVIPNQLESALAGFRALGFRGANVTIPHKMAASDLVDELRGDAQLLQAVNNISCVDGALLGFNTDSKGFEAFMLEAGIDVENRLVTVLGAGGAARGVVLAVARQGAARVFVMNRTSDRTLELKALLKRAICDSEISERTFDNEGARVINESDLIINCTPLGKRHEDMPPIDVEDFHQGQWVVDLKYRETGLLLREAAARGAGTA
ncbi:MAG: hypothetical protein A2V52_03150, partial [Actinobacteria bacterium RBG_19FT_COMBO_54_7]